MGKTAPLKNIARANYVAALFCRLRLLRTCHWQCVKGSSRVIGNDRAYQNADKGASGSWKTGPLTSLRRAGFFNDISEHKLSCMDFSMTNGLTIADWSQVAE